MNLTAEQRAAQLRRSIVPPIAQENLDAMATALLDSHRKGTDHRITVILAVNKVLGINNTASWSCRGKRKITAKDIEDMTERKAIEALCRLYWERLIDKLPGQWSTSPVPPKYDRWASWQVMEDNLAEIGRVVLECQGMTWPTAS